MTIPAAIHELVRERAGYRCEYCGVHEMDAGGELTIDHYRPRTQGGSDDSDNLIYACSRCNTYKHDYWPANPDASRLWNPREEPFAAHLVENPDGILEARSPTGAFTISKLRLNRPQLVANRQRRQQAAESRRQLELYRGTVVVLGQLLAERSAVAKQQSELLQEYRDLLVQLLSRR